MLKTTLKASAFTAILLLVSNISATDDKKNVTASQTDAHAPLLKLTHKNRKDIIKQRTHQDPVVAKAYQKMIDANSEQVATATHEFKTALSAQKKVASKIIKDKPTYTKTEELLYHGTQKMNLAWQWIKANPYYAIPGAVAITTLAIVYLNAPDAEETSNDDDEYDYEDEA